MSEEKGDRKDEREESRDERDRYIYIYRERDR